MAHNNNNNNNQGSSNDTDGLQSGDAVASLQHMLSGVYGSEHVHALDDFLPPSGPILGHQSFPYNNFSSSLAAMQELSNSNSSILPVFSPAENSVPLILGWELALSGLRQVVGHTLSQGYTQIGLFSGGIDDFYVVRPLFVSSENLSFLDTKNLVTMIGIIHTGDTSDVLPWYCRSGLADVTAEIHKDHKEDAVYSSEFLPPGTEFYFFTPDDINGTNRHDYSVPELLEFAAKLLTPTVLGKRERAESVVEASSSTNKTTSTKRPKATKPATIKSQQEFIKLWMVTSRYSQTAENDTVEACSAAVAAKFKADAVLQSEVNKIMIEHRSTIWKSTGRILSTASNLKDYITHRGVGEKKNNGAVTFTFDASLSSESARCVLVLDLIKESLNDYAFAHSDTDFCSDLVRHWIKEVLFEGPIPAPFHELVRQEFPRESDDMIAPEIVAHAVELLQSRYKDVQYTLLKLKNSNDETEVPNRYGSWNTTVKKVDAAAIDPKFVASYVEWRKGLSR